MSDSVGRSMFRGMLWGLSAVFLLLLVLVTVKSRRHEPPPKLSALPGFALTDQHGQPVRLDDLLGTPWVADFIFTRCPGPCPLMSQKMGQLGVSLPPGVRRVSFTVDPDHDTPEVLRDYAEKWGPSPSWLFLTGSREALWELSVKGFKMGVAESSGSPEEQGPIVHSTRFVLVDGEGTIRGYYDGFERPELARLLTELRAILKER